MRAERVCDVRCELGEAPLWHAGERCLYWLDCPAGRMHRWDPAAKTHSSVECGAELGALLPGDDGALLLLGYEGFVRVWRDSSLGPVQHATPAQRGYRFNDACVDAQGRVLCGVRAIKRPSQAQAPSLTQRVRRKLVAKLGMQRPAQMDPALGLYQLDAQTRLSQLVSGIGLSNGLGFSPDQRTLYHADSTARCVFRYSYDVPSGHLGARETFIRFDASEGAPDGLTVDAEGNVWVALWGGGAIVCVGADGRRQRRVVMPARNITSLTFGGDDYGTLFVTSAVDTADTRNTGGALFALQPGVRGVPEHRTPLTRSLGVSVRHAHGPGPSRPTGVAKTRVLITGAAGALGKKLSSHLRERAEIDLVLLDRDPRGDARIHAVDLSEPSDRWAHFFEGVDAVLHLAGASAPATAWSELQRDNIDSLMHTLDVASAAHVRRFVFASSNFVMFGHRHDSEWLDTARASNPITPYGFVKAAGERICARYAEQGALSVVSLRIGAVSPGTQGPEAFMDTWYRQMWLSDRDLCQVVERALSDRAITCAVLNAMSNNVGMRWDLSETRALLGYEPQDAAPPFVPVQRSVLRRAVSMARRAARKRLRGA